MTQNIHQQRKEIFKRLKMTKRGESICLQEWQVSILVNWIESLIRRNVKLIEERKKES